MDYPKCICGTRRSLATRFPLLHVGSHPYESSKWILISSLYEFDAHYSQTTTIIPRWMKIWWNFNSIFPVFIRTWIIPPPCRWRIISVWFADEFVYIATIYGSYFRQKSYWEFPNESSFHLPRWWIWRSITSRSQSSKWILISSSRWIRCSLLSHQTDLRSEMGNKLDYSNLNNSCIIFA